MSPQRLISLFVALTFSSLVCSAQFYTSENDPAGTKWMSLKGQKFNIIYPEDCEELAKKYAAEFEKYRIPLGASLGFCGGDYQKKPVPVIIHSKNMAANGMVTWAPSRIEVNSLPEWDEPSAMPWSTMLAVHEGRHFAQMQFGYRHVFRPFYWLLGQMVPGALAGVYPDKLLLEGDAVVAETALSASGRGRSGDFLLRYMYSFDSGDVRDWSRWRFGSYYRPAPNYYAFGYFVISGMRVKYDAPLFMADYFDYVSRRPYDPWPLRHTMRRTSGKKFQQTFKEIRDFQYGDWAENTAVEEPCAKAAPLLEKQPKHLRSYSDPVDLGDCGSLWKRSDMYRNAELVLIGRDGKEKVLTSLGGVLGKINYNPSDSSLVWNELRTDPRWKQKVVSIVRRYHIPSGVKRVVAATDNCIYPVAFNDSSAASISYYEDGSEWITLISKGKTVSKLYPLPDSLQAIQVCVHKGEIYVTAISSKGSGIYKADGTAKTLKEILPPAPVQIRSLSSFQGRMTFRSDFNGRYELYQLDSDNGQLQRLTSSRYGGYDFALTSRGDVLTSQISRWGSEPCIIKADSLTGQKVSWDKYHHYAIADILSDQERTLPQQDSGADTTFSNPVRYKKADNGIRIHSWAPFYTDVSAIMDASLDIVDHPADLGAMVFFQNNHSTFSGWAGYSAAKDKNGEWFHAGHINLTYKGLYPVFELDAHYGESDAVDYYYNAARDSLCVRKTGNLLFRAGLKTYVPLSWSDNAALYGVIPTVGIKYHNNSFEGRTSFFLNASLRGYVMSRTPQGCIYPRWGVGAEVAYTQPFVHFYLYGYVPGVCLGQGLRLTAVNQQVVREGAMFLDTFVNVVPRGFQGLRMYSGSKLTLDYAIPFYMGDWHIGTAFYCKRGIFTPHFDYATNHRGGSLGSAGASLELEFASFLWVRAPITVGATFSVNSWNGFENTSAFNSNYAGMLFNISLP